ncbi:MAG: excinuclease ABC subunit UvrC [Alphaproteobacteria bacterium]|nr:excinuclease ABC subunit UvrC [Alphaproteobacteria bacterium]
MAETPPSQPSLTLLEQGTATIISYVKTLPGKPGVYRMLNAKGNVLYVGKAKDLKKRVSSYIQTSKLPNRLQRMVAETTAMEFVITHTEAEALLLEANLIKKFYPPYNILLKDGKSFLYLYIQKNHPWPKIGKHRGPLQVDADYYGPFASADAVEETLTTMHRAFLLRSCTDHVFTSRTRPCLQYHIKRCSAPCVRWVSSEVYQTYLSQARAFLQGKSNLIQKELADQMLAFSNKQNYEQAATFRDRIRALTKIQSQQSINIPQLEDTDVLAIHQEAGQSCVQVFFFRNGSNYGSGAFFPRHDRQETIEKVLGAFIGQFYAGQIPPKLILINYPLEEQTLLESALSQSADHSVRIQIPSRGKKKDLVSHAADNAKEALRRKLAESTTQLRLLKDLERLFHIEGPLERIEVYDNSHIQGAHAIGAMIVAGPEGFVKKAYRKFNIKTAGQGGITPGDDYGMMREVFSRRFRKSLSQDYEEHTLPDLIIVDGGKGQLSSTLEILADLGLSQIPLVAIAKGAARIPGEERFFLPNQPELQLDPKDPAFYFIQRLRDEAHRFAIGTHRKKRAKALGQSMLDAIAGIGNARKRALLRHFGSAVSVSQAAITDLANVEGISLNLAKKIYRHFHSKE